MSSKPTPPPEPRNALSPAGVMVFAVAALAAMLALNAPAMLRSAETLPAGSAAGAFARKTLPPPARVSETLRLAKFRAAAEALERRWLEPPPATLPSTDPEPDDDNDDDLDKFLFD